MNKSKKCNGIILQLPIPKHLNETKLIESIDYKKDVDGLTDINAGRLLHNKDSLVACTSYGIMELLNFYNIDVESKNVVIVGRSNLVSKPLYSLFLNANATVTMCHSKTVNLEKFTKEADILVGTQMVTKGHNFPSVTLVGVMLADMMLYTSDYRASERTFSMLTQVIGRAGRASDKGVAVIQTNAPNDRTILFAAEQDYDSFYQNEIQIRKAYQFPPFCDLAVITVSSPLEAEASKVSGDIITRLETGLKKGNIPAIAYGPFEAPVYKAQGRYRKRIIVKCKLTSPVREIFSDILITLSKSSQKAKISIDFNPVSL